MYIFGSHLLKKYFPNFRNPNDTDYVTNSLDEFNENKVNLDSNTELYYIPMSPDREMTANELYTLKCSHAIYDIHWSKTMSDIRFMQLMGCEIDEMFFNELRQYWQTIHTNKRQDFNTDREQFFKDRVKRNIDHDELHLIFNQDPPYKKIIEGVAPKENLFNDLDYNEKIDICNEEAYVIACERFVDIYPPGKAYHEAQRSLVTKLHPIFISDFIIQNWSIEFWTTKNNYYEIYKRRITGKN